MKRKEKTENGILRLGFAAVALIVQIVWILLRFQYLNDYSDRIAAITALLTIVVVLKLNSKHTNSAMKMPWVMLIMASPVMGLCMYLLFELLGDPGVGKRLRLIREKMRLKKIQSAREAFLKLEQENTSVANQSRYLWHTAGYPVYGNTQVKYYPERLR